MAIAVIDVNVIRVTSVIPDILNLDKFIFYHHSFLILNSKYK
jgi:hypothetical protein